MSNPVGQNDVMCHVINNPVGQNDIMCHVINNSVGQNDIMCLFAALAAPLYCQGIW